jgi:hypothetical protein
MSINWYLCNTKRLSVFGETLQQTMIQRIQTIYLLLAMICTGFLWMFPLFDVSVRAEGVEATASLFANTLGGDGLSKPVNLFYIYISFLLLNLFGILLYKSRKRQIMICRLNLIIQLLYTIAVYVFYYFGRDFVAKEIFGTASYEAVTFSAQAGIYLLVPPLAFIWLAIRSIKRDEDLIKSLDRLR